MSGITRNSTTLYLRSSYNIQPYVVRGTARWLVKKGYYREYDRAIYFLARLEYSNVMRFKNIIAMYHDDTDYVTNYMPDLVTDFARVNEYQTGNNNSYGERHMYWI